MAADTETPAAVPLGTIKSFGDYGPRYEVIAALAALPGGERMVRIRVLESGEEADYPYSQMLKDPDAE